MRISPTSTSYPVLAVIQYHKIPECYHGVLYDFGRELFEIASEGRVSKGDNLIYGLVDDGTLPPEVIVHMLINAERAARNFGYWRHA